LGVRTLGRLAEAEKQGALVELLRDHRAADRVEEGDGGALAIAGTLPGEAVAGWWIRFETKSLL
jgi:hypothetical protein